MKQTAPYTEGPYITPDSNALRFTPLYVALDLVESDAGYPIIRTVLENLGASIRITPTLWHVEGPYSLQHVFKTINTSMLDRRIDSDCSLLVLDPKLEQARWHLRQPLSDLMRAHWDYQQNVFISFQLAGKAPNWQTFMECITRLGIWAPLNKTIWYLSTPYSSKEVFQSLLDMLNSGDHLCIYDSSGNLATWHDGSYSLEEMA